MIHRLLATAGIALALLTTLRGQQVPHSATAANGGLPVDRVQFDRHPDGTLWALGRTYKMRFGDGTAQFVPFFGSTAPHNFPITFSLREVTAGQGAMPLPAPSAADRVGNRIAWGHGPVQEYWDLTLQGAEQTFALAAPLGDGDLVLRLDVATELAMQPANGGIDFANQFGRVRYSQAVLVDARGVRTPLPTHLHGDGIAIVVPAATLAGAAFPVVIDPLVSTTVVANSTYNEHNLDSVYDAAHDAWMLAWEGDFSASDHDVGTQIAAANGSPMPGSFVYIDFTTDSWVDPRIAGHPQDGACLVAAQRVVPDQQIWGRVRFFGTSIVGPQFQISVNGGSHPDVGGDVSQSGALLFYVVWHRGGITSATVLGRRVDSTSLPIGAEVALGTGATNISFPAIAKCAGADSPLGLGWPVVWPVPAQSTAAPHRIRGVLVQGNGAPQAPEADWFSHPTQALQLPRVSSLTDAIANQRYFMVVWQQDVGGQYDIYAGVRSLQTNPIVAATNLSPLLAIGGGFEQTPVVDSFGSRFCLAYAQSTLFFPNDIRAATLDLPTSGSGLTIGIAESPVFLSSSTSSSPDNLNPRICSAHSGGGSEPGIAPRYLVTWDRAGDVVDATYDAFRASGGYTLLATGCVGLGIYGTGVPHAGNYIAGGLLNQGANPTLVAIGLPLSPTLPICPNCQLGVDPGTATLVAGPQISFPLPPIGGFAGYALAVQGIALGPPSCLGGLILGDTLRVVLQ